MRKRMKKGVSVLLTAAMAASMLAGCGGSDEASTDNSTVEDVADAADDAADAAEDTADAAEDAADTADDAADAADDTAAAGDYTDYSGGFPDQVTIKIPVYDRGFEGWNNTDNYYTQWIQSEFGDKYNVNVEYVAISRGNEVQDYMQMIAAGNAPDIIMHYDMPQAVNYMSEGAMQELDLNEIAYYAPTYYERLKDTIDKYGSINGQNMFFFAERNPIYYNWVTLIRQDWLDEVGADMPTNLDELNEVARKWKEAGLGKLGASLVKGAFTYEYGFIPDGTATEELAQYLDLNVAPFTWAPSKDYLKNLKMQYDEGLILPDFYTVEDDAALKAQFVSGQIGTYSFYISSSTDVISSLLANDANAKVATMNGGAGSPTGKQPYYQYPPYGMIMGINSTTSDEARAAVWMFLDWMIQPENLFYLQNGPEGETYELDSDGIAIPIADYDGDAKRSNNNNKDYWCLVQEIVDYGDEDLNYKANLMALAPADYEYLVEDSYKYAKEQEPNGIITPIFTKAIESTSEYSSDLNAMWQEFYVDLVTKGYSDDEFDAKYEEYCQEYLDGGYQAILDEKEANFSEGSYIAE